MKNSIIVTILFTCLFAFTANAQFNLAERKNATQSSNYKNGLGSASLAVDGNTDGRWNSKSVSHTKDGGTSNPWWKVSLGSIKYVKEILIWNRTDCCKQRLNNLVVSIYNGSNWVRVNKTNHRYSPGIQYPLKFKVNKKASWVKVQLQSPNGILSLAEVQVIGDVVKNTKKALSSTAKTVKSTGVRAADEARKGIATVSNEVKKAIPVMTRAKTTGKPTACEKGSFFDFATNGCWTCPKGYKRTVASVKSQNACEKAATENFAIAKVGGRGSGLLGTDCPKGYFWDPNGKCYQCPNGFNRTAYGVTTAKACSQKVNSSFKRATKKGTFLCKSGFYDAGTNKCWTCPNGYKRTVFGVDGEKACEKAKR